MVAPSKTVWRGPVLLVGMMAQFAFWLFDVGFSLPRQAIGAFREREGSSASAPIRQTEPLKDITTDEKKLITSLVEAGKRGDWIQVMRLWRGYSGQAVPVYSAAMQAAHRSGHFKEASRMYDGLRSDSQAKVDAATLHLGIKTYGKLLDQGRVLEIWREAEERGLVNKIIAGARVDAASEMGNMTEAVAVLDDMERRSLEANIINFNSALNACKNADHRRRHEAAMFLFETMLARSLEPTVVTFSNLVGAHRAAPLQQISELRGRMASLGIPANRVFAETYVGAVCGRFEKVRDAGQMAQKMVELPKERREEARIALRDFRTAGVELTHVTVVPYFTVPEGKLDEFKAGFPKFYAGTKAGTGECHYYGFCGHENKVFCREGYKSAAGVLAHLGDVKEALDAAVGIVGPSGLDLSVMGPAAELEKLKEAMGPLGAKFWELDSGSMFRGGLTEQDTHVTIVPYFTVPEGKMDEFKAGFPKFYEGTRAGTSECIYYGFCVHENKVFCREGYKSAAGVLAHLGDVKEALDAAVGIVGPSGLDLSVMGPAAELEKLKEAMGPLGAKFWELDTGAFWK
ncbi:unnamed protein product [Symbiodinium sp. CCMP2456]|nr:unnamed protein product [Symbiodinium sp. CCMP2456]